MKIYFLIVNFFIILLSSQVASSQDTQLNLEKPSADQIFLYVETISKNKNTNKVEAKETLNKWLQGDLNKISLPGKVPPPGTGDAKTLGSVDQCALCLGTCCFALGCNPVCVAGCIGSNICK